MAFGMDYQQASDPMLQQILLSQSESAPMQKAKTVGGVRPLTEMEIKSAIEMEITDSLGQYGSYIHEQRRVNLRRYYGKPLGNEVEGSSAAQTSTVSDTIEWMMPSVMKSVFGSTKNIWNFQPTSPWDEPYAIQASDTINHVFRNECNGFEKIYDMCKTALLEKRGYLAVYLDERYEPQQETYRGLSEQWLGTLMSDQNLEVVGFAPHEGEVVIDPMTGAPMETFDVTVKRITKTAKIRIDSIPPEHMLLPRRETELNDDTRFSGYRKKMTVGELISLGYDADIVSTAPQDSRAEWSEGRVERLYDENSFPSTQVNRTDGASRQLWVNFIWMRIDEDGDGYAELRNIVCIGDSGIVILDDREVSYNPLCSICPIPMPHKFFGMCPADEAVDLQVISSTVLRQILDNMYRINNGRYAAVEGAVNMKDLVENKPGGVVRVQSLDAVTALATPQLPNTSFEVLNYVEKMGEKRTGVSSWQQGPDAADMKYQTSGAVSNVATASESRMTLINQIFAQTGIRQIGEKMLHIMCTQYTKPIVIKLRGQWVECDPRDWNPKMGCEVEAGLGVGDSEAKMKKLMATSELQTAMLGQGLRQVVTPKNLYNTAKEFEKLLDIAPTGTFFTDPGDQPWPEPQPDFEEQVKFQESERRAMEDQSVDNQATLDLAVRASNQEAIDRFKYFELQSKERMKVVELHNQQEVVRIQVEGQIRSAVANRQQQAA